MRKLEHIMRFFAYAKTKTQISCAVTAQLISVFVFAARVVLSLFFLNLKFQASSLFLRLFCIVPGRKPRDQFSRDAAHTVHVRGAAWILCSF